MAKVLGAEMKMLRGDTHRFLLCVLAVLVLHPAGGYSADGAELTAEEIRAYLTPSELDDEAAESIELRKWTTDWRIYVLPSTSQILEKQSASKLLVKLSQLIGLRVETVDSLKDATIVLSNESNTDNLLSESVLGWYLSNQKSNDDVRAMIELMLGMNADCTWLFAGDPGLMERAIVHVSSRQSAEKTNQCLARSLMKTAGVRGEPARVTSVLSGDTIELSPHDEAVLKLLYSSRTRVGMTLRDLLQQLEQ
jgi:hypothetical protein